MSDPTFHEVMQWTPEQARGYLEKMRWPDGPVCPNGCASEVYRFEAKVNRTRKDGTPTPTRHLLKCAQCRRQFTATVGTIFEDSKIPLNKWLASIYLMCASKKGVSAHQIHRMLGVTYRTAWFMCHRVRHAMQDKSGTLLSGTIEADETYVGGKLRGHKAHRAGKDRSERHQLANEKKTPVFGMLERGGRVRPIVIPSMGRREVMDALEANVDMKNSVLMTDESHLYGRIRNHLPHHTVKHAEEYVTGEGIHTQGIENFWSILKRQLFGTHHHVEERFLGMYADEAAYKHNTRKQTDGGRFASALQQSNGRLAWYVGRQASSSREQEPQ